MGELEWKVILELSLINLIFFGTTGISSGLWLDRYNRRQSKSVEKQNIEKINKANRGRVKKKSRK